MNAQRHATPSLDAPRPVAISWPGTTINGDLQVPDGASAIVVFAHGSGSSRHSPRNQYVAQTLVERRLATLLIDLLSDAEESVDLFTRHLRFDIQMLADRVARVTDWLQAEPGTVNLRIGYFGASTGAAAALVAAAARPAIVGAVVSRGGRPDLAGDALSRVQAPTLLIVGGNDQPVIDLNREAMAKMPGEVRLEIVPGATHLFEEPGTLEEVAELAGEWFERHLGGRR